MCFSPCQLSLQLQEQEPDLLLFPQPYCHLNPSDRILAVPRGQEHPAGALEALQSLKAEKMKIKSRAAVLRGSWACRGSCIPQTQLGAADFGISACGGKLGVAFSWKCCAIPRSGWTGEMSPLMAFRVPSKPPHSMNLWVFWESGCLLHPATG